MNPNEIPLNTSYELTNDEFTNIVITRMSPEELQAVYRHPVTQDVVLDIRTKVNGEDARLAYVDPVFWRVTLDGHAATESDLEDLARMPQVSFEADSERRTLKIAVLH